VSLPEAQLLGLIKLLRQKSIESSVPTVRIIAKLLRKHRSNALD